MRRATTDTPIKKKTATQHTAKQTDSGARARTQQARLHARHPTNALVLRRSSQISA